MPSVAIEFRTASTDGSSSRAASVNFADLPEAVSLPILCIGSLLLTWGACRAIRFIVVLGHSLVKPAILTQTRMASGREDGP